jgi:hypothetical protein
LAPPTANSDIKAKVDTRVQSGLPPSLMRRPFAA